MAWSHTESLRKLHNWPILLAGGSIASCLIPASALAFALPANLTNDTYSPLACSGQAIEPQTSVSVSEGMGSTKSAAILGGQPSALDLIRQQQSGLDSGPESMLISAAVIQTAIAPLSYCLTSSEWVDHFDEQPVSLASSEDFLDSQRVGIRKTPFNDDWQRVSSRQLSSRRANSLIGIESSDAVETLAQVNAWANQHIEFTDDYESYGTRDHWATAEETLASGVGDCEDYAILKYQLLSALGFDRSQMYLTLARDLVRNADHAVLVVRVGGQDYLLDNSTNALLPADASYDYRPTMSFNSESAWLHGYTAQNRASARSRSFAYLSDNALSSALVTGRSR